MRTLSTLIVLAGCDGLFGLQHIPDRADASATADDDASTAGAVDARPGCTLDTFSRGIIGFGELWNREYTPPSSDVVIEAGKLAIKIAPGVVSSDVFGFAFTNRDYNLTDATVSVRVERVIGPGDAETFFEIELDDANYYYFAAVNGTLQMRLSRSDSDEQIKDIPFDPVQHLYWRLQHSSARKAVVFLTSADGVSWTERHAINAALAVDHMFVEVGGGIYSGAVPDGTSLFDDVELCLP